MKKLGIKVALFFTLISFLFTGCLDFWGSVLQDVMSPVKSIQLYDDDIYSTKGESADPIEFSVGERYTIKYQIEYDVTNSKPITFYLKSTNEEVAKPVDSEISTSLMDGSFEIEAIGKGDCQIRMYIEGYAETDTANSLATAGYDVIYVKVTPEKTVKILDSNGNPLTKLTMYKGDTMYLSYTNTYDNRSVKWNTSNGYVVSVDSSGKIKALSKGDATITLSTFLNEKQASCDITVLDSNNWSVKISSSDMPGEIYPKDKIKFTSSVNVDNGVSTAVNWESDNKAVAVVSSDGTVTAVSEGEANIYAVLAKNTSIKSNSVKITVSRAKSPANQFFWGKWQRMDTGDVYEIQETQMVCDAGEHKGNYKFDSSSATELEITGFGKLTKDTERIVKWHDAKKDIDIPFYRQGGTDLKYKLRVVGFEDEINNSNFRAAGTDAGIKAKAGLTVKAQSETYSGYKKEATTDSDGYVELIAPVQGDSQTITVVDTVTNEIVVVPGLKIDNDNANMGTIALVGKEDYSLKVTGTIDEKDTNNGYLYGNSYKTYPLTLTITNISEIWSATSSCKISTEDPNLELEIVSAMYELDDVGISSLAPNATKTINLKVKYGALVNDYVNTEIKIEVQNQNTYRTWIDYVPLRFFAGQMPISIAATTTEGNTESLNGFLIYPDGNSTFFKVPGNGDVDKNGTSYKDDNYILTSQTIYVPIFGKLSEVPYKMVFCGADVNGDLQKSKEMFYTVNFDSEIATKPDTKVSLYGSKYEPNNDELAAQKISEKEFEAYLSHGDIDFYTINVESSSTKVYK